jgi:hypothetical protein
MMATPSLWQQCIAQHDAEVRDFISRYFAEEDRRCLLIAGVGFDPRTLVVAQLLASALGSRLHARFIREHRPKPNADLVARGDQHAAALSALVAESKLLNVDVLDADDNAVVGGRRVVQLLMQDGMAQFTDIVVDCSAFSAGISFPITRYVLESCRDIGVRPNVHLMVASNPELDAAVTSVAHDAVDPIHGFSGRLDLEGTEEDAKIWMPHLSRSKVSALQLVRDKLRGPVTVCPVLPLSQRNPRAADELIEVYETELYEGWEVSSGDLVYAVEDDPLDLYRTISAIYRRYTRVFAGVTNSHVVLTPSGSKVLAIGALMAALEHDLPVRYVEAVAYEVDWEAVRVADPESSRLVHVWLHGEPYVDPGPLMPAKE